MPVGGHGSTSWLRYGKTILMITRTILLSACIAGLAAPQSATGADQTKPGAGNASAAALASDSELIRSAYEFLKRQISRIQDPRIRSATVDALTNPRTCIASRAGLDAGRKAAIVQKLIQEGLVNPADATPIQGGLNAGVFPPVIDDGSACPALPMPVDAAPGGSFGGHHSHPGGLMLHEQFNVSSSLSLIDNYRRVYRVSGSGLNQDLLIAAPLWHDWAKAIVFQWNADGSEFTELNLGGNGSTDAWGQPGDSRTGAHHVITIAEMMKRGLPPELVITTASAHSAPTLGNEYKVVNWLRTAALLAQIDPVAQGFLYLDGQKHLRLPPLRKLASVSLPGTYTLAEYVIHNLSDDDYSLTITAIADVQTVLASVAPRFRFDPADQATYNTQFRNKVLSYLSAERLWMIYANQGEDGVTAEIVKIKGKLK
jgi:hypothetical protein